MVFNLGQTVRTPDGQIGEIVKPATNGGSAGSQQYTRSDEREIVLIYAVLTEEGELRHFSYAALSKSNKSPS
ncbi:hypothetical protein [Microbacterium sp. NPDC056736]|uniref:hypothetical protein n=1 Tax=Microbacterium sp. NPDC056736 TaxID=3345932 RepID=UPI00366B21C7